MTLSIHKPRVALVATINERLRLSAALEAHMHVIGSENFFELRRAIARGDTDGVILSAAQLRLAAVSTPQVADLVRSFPAIVFVGLVDELQAGQATAAAHALGLAGIPTIADTRYREGYEALRSTFDGAGADVFALRVVRDLLAGATFNATPGFVQFLHTVMQIDVTRGYHVADRLGVVNSTMQTRFFRAALPSPQEYIDRARLAWYAHLSQQPGLSLAAIAARMQCSSSQSLGRFIREHTGMTGAKFRSVRPAEVIARFREELITAQAAKLDGFDPTTGTWAKVRLPVAA